MKQQLAYAIVIVAAAAVCLSAWQTAKPPSGSTSAMKPMSDQEIIKTASSAAPADISANAAIVHHGEDGKARELRAGTNGWVCMAHPEVMCLDKQWQEWADAWMNKRNPKISAVGIGYMLRGDRGASNTDPYAAAPSATNQWVVSPAHIMILTPDIKQLDALPTDSHNGGPWVMWKGTPYAHIMVPTVPMPKK
jgi:hypothetical protein